MIPGIVAHLWQSTLFAGAAWLAAVAMRRNRAQVRYWLWLAASVKFLIPFSLLVRLGSLMPRPVAVPAGRAAWVTAMQTFSLPPTPDAIVAHPALATVAASPDYRAAAAMALWACGFAAVAICWLVRWRQVHALRNSARALRIPATLAIPVPVMAAPDVVEPGIFGLLRPVLLLPEGISELLHPAQLDAILAHEICHVRRKDNLTAALHMAVQAIFWFHPLTWWIGARLVEERERACDEEVLRLGYQPNVYAESILTVCRLYLSSPLACVAGVTGANLKQRIESIMRNRRVLELSFRRKLALATSGLAVLIVPVMLGIAQNAPDWQTAAGGKMAFEVASVKPSLGPFVPPSFPLNTGDSYRPTGGSFRADFPLWTYIQFAYKIWPGDDESHEILAHVPKWVTTDRYTIDARAATGNPTKDQMRLMVQSLLAERFHLATHLEARELQVFALTLVKAGKPGPNLVSHSDGPPCDRPGASPGQGLAGFPPGCGSPAVLRKSGGALMLLGYRNGSMDALAGALSSVVLGRPVIDRTGLTGKFDLTIEWAPDSAAPQPADPPGPSALQALREQLGLKVESTKASVPVLIIDKVERPTEN